MDEMLELVELGVLTTEDLDEAIKTEFPSCRSGFKNKEGEALIYLTFLFSCNIAASSNLLSYYTGTMPLNYSSYNWVIL